MNLLERASLMAEKWGDLPVEKKIMYKQRAEKVDESPLENLSPEEKKRMVVRIAKCHQADVSFAIDIVWLMHVFVS